MTTTQQPPKRITKPLPAISHTSQQQVASHPPGPERLWPIVVILSAVVAGLMNFVFTDTPIRPFIILWFLAVCPGMILVRFLHLKEPVVEWVLALTLSFAIDALVAAIQLYAGWWSPTVILSIVICLSLGAAGVQLVSKNFIAKLLHSIPMPSITISIIKMLYGLVNLPRGSQIVTKLFHTLHSGKPRTVLVAALTLFIAIIIGVNLWPYAVHEGSHATTSASALPHRTISHSSPGQQTNATAMKSGLYYGTMYNLAAKTNTSISLTDISPQRKISGTFTGLPVGASFAGTIDAANHIQLTVTANTGHILLSFDGVVRSDNTIIGSYCSLDQVGQCAGKYGYGLWSIAPAS